VEQKCFGHLNDFAHLDSDLAGPEAEFDLGFKFERRDAREPFWVLNVSYTSTASRPVLRGTLHFAASSSSIGQEELLARVRPFLVDALRALKMGKTFPGTADSPQYV